VRGDDDFAFGISLSIQTDRSDAIGDAYQGHCCGARALRLSAHSCGFAAGGLDDQSQKGVSLYRQEGLSLFERRPKRHRSALQRPARPAAQAINECWCMDFVSDQLYDGRKLRALTLIDAYTRECLAIWVDQGIRGEDVVRVLAKVSLQRAAPQRIQVDNGPEFVSQVLDRWAYERRVELAFSRPGKPTDNAHIEAFNGRLRQECLNQHWFLSLDDARAKIEAWRGIRESRYAPIDRLNARALRANGMIARSTGPSDEKFNARLPDK